MAEKIIFKNFKNKNEFAAELIFNNKKDIFDKELNKLSINFFPDWPTCKGNKLERFYGCSCGSEVYIQVMEIVQEKVVVIIIVIIVKKQLVNFGINI